MPKPRSGENRDDFLERCMGDEEAISDFPDPDQRYAFCNSQWDNSKGVKIMEKKFFDQLSINIKSSDEEKREITAVGSRQAVDRDGDLLHLDGLSLTNYRKNPVVLWSHNSHDLPIGKANRVWVDGKDLKFKIKFTEPDVNPFADSVYKLVKGGFINSLSIGFMPDWTKAKFNEKRGGYDFEKSELLEVSMVNVPANSGARVIQRSLDKAVEAGVLDELERKDFELTLEKSSEEIDSEESTEKNVLSELSNKLVDLEKEVERLSNIVNKLKSDDKSVEPSSLDNSPSDNEDVHIVDQFFSEYFELSDSSDESVDNSIEDSEKNDDLNSFVDEVLN